jgi:hypothetical protein
MTPLEVLRKHYVGKTIVSAPGNLNRFVGCKIVFVGMDCYEPMFEFTVQYPDGIQDFVTILHDWNIEVA